ncbi:MAG TPA: class IV adenylate cyclase [Gemmatimonadaceae bacterium]|nr:class IV adenylate cyclase [Gemmatimonadaceae bacterium]
MREVELKALVPDLGAARARLERAGARLVYEGRLEDRRYDAPDRSLAARDHVLQLRVYRDGASGAVRSAALDWKGPTGYENGYKVREELSSDTRDPGALADILAGLGYVVTREIDREIAQYEVAGAVVRFERYPRMDTLVEVEGTPEAIEAAAGATGLPRETFTSDRLPAFVARFEARTGERAALCDRELAGDYRFSVGDA